MKRFITWLFEKYVIRPQIRQMIEEEFVSDYEIVYHPRDLDEFEAASSTKH